MASPTFIQEAETAWSTATSPKVTSSFNVQTNDVLVAFAMMEDGGQTVSISSSPSLTWTQKQVFPTTTDTNNTYVSVWTAVASSSTSMTATFTRSSGTALFGGNVLTFRGAAVGTSSKTNGAGAPSLTFSTTGDGSAVVVASADWNAIDGTSPSLHVWRTVNSITPTAANNLEVTYDNTGHDSTYLIYGAYYNDAGTTGSKTVGLSSPAGQKYGIVAVEVLGQSGTTYTKTGAGVSSLSATGTRSRTVSPRTGLGISAFSASGSKVKTNQIILKTGLAIVGRGPTTWTKTGSGVSALVALGLRVRNVTKTGSGVSSLSASGAKTKTSASGTTYTKTGLAVVGRLPATFSKTGKGVLTASASGVDQKIVNGITYPKTGLAIVGRSATVQTKTGKAVLGPNASGASLRISASHTKAGGGVGGMLRPVYGNLMILRPMGLQAFGTVLKISSLTVTSVSAPVNVAAQAPSIIVTASVAAPAGAVSCASPVPSLLITSTIVAPSAVINAAVQTPSISSSSAQTVIATTAIVAVGAPAPSVSVSFNSTQVTPAAAVSVAAVTPALSSSSSKTVAATSATVSVSITTPSVQSNSATSINAPSASVSVNSLVPVINNQFSNTIVAVQARINVSAGAVGASDHLLPALKSSIYGRPKTRRIRLSRR